MNQKIIDNKIQNEWIEEQREFHRLNNKIIEQLRIKYDNRSPRDLFLDNDLYD
ncbi:hypothetical protein [Wansuia hejianensis]|uniref:Uncharacterized protein n=1 Tax=Wansuia hejianensis TaxID=2763667 RepID=A0A926EVI0_9FIRM|nr:hypothetical protein [Wansuia hejianensis]MBC8590643.1 hypothetical protein [Wansuia hejianensis]